MSSLPIRVLVVDDDAVWRRIICHTLEKHNVTCVQVDCLEEATSVLSSSRFDLVLLDYELPDGEGLALLDRFDRCHLARVVLITGYADRSDLHDDRSLAVDGYLTKPFLSSDLVAFLDGLQPAGAEPLLEAK
jgi:DNA-binding response OmpR family regulator